MKKFEAIVFDMDGLLLDSERIVLEAFLRVCDHFDLGDQTELLKQCIGTNRNYTRTRMTEVFGPDIDFGEFQKRWTRKHEEIVGDNAMPLMDGALELLEHIRILNIPVAVATSTRYEHALDRLEKAGLLEYFEFVVGGDQVKNSKPDPEIYLAATQKLGSNPLKSLAFEDSENGVRAALGAGLTVIQVPDLVVPSTEVIALGHTILDSLLEVPKLKLI
ncbi:MAG: HAD superfamily hydrolase (TIGR01509 family) [Candidatus Azotimanducaceae bacterium]|jgi:HAD superfamily hydrolase (TIGR01509 family)